MSNTERYLWYACYGSNLRAERFEIYLTGGSLRINDHTVTEKGCRDKRPPQASEVARIPYRLVFAGQFKKWENKSAAFLDLSHKEHNLQTFEQENAQIHQSEQPAKPLQEEMQLSFFDAVPDPVLTRLRNVDLMNTTPSQALQLLEELKEKL